MTPTRFARALCCVLTLTLGLPAPGLAALPAPGVLPALDRSLGNIDLRDASLGEAIRVIAKVSGLNVVATQGVSERRVSIFLQDASARAAIDTIARVAGLWYRYLPESRSFLLMSAEEYQRDISIFREEQTRSFHMKHHNVVAAANAVRALFGTRVQLTAPVEERLGEQVDIENARRSGTRSSRSDTATLAAGAGTTNSSAGRQRSAGSADPEDLMATAAQVARGESLSRDEIDALRQGTQPPIHVTYNRLHNLLIVRTGDERAMTQVAQLIDDIDLPTRQVLLEMRIVEVSLDDEFRRAFDVDIFSGSDTTGTAGSQPVNPLNQNASSGPKVAAALGNFDLDTESTGIFQFINSRVRARLQLLEEKGKVKTLARPMVMASNNEPARLFIGEEVVLVTGATADTTTTENNTLTSITTDTETRDIGTTLVVHPRINDDRTVTLTIDQETSRRVRGGTTIPLSVGDNEILDYPIDTIETSNIQVAALAKDALTIAVGGLIRAESSTSRQQVPGFGNIPVIGNLFSRDVETDTRSEMILLVTPHILETGEESAQRSRREMSPAVEEEAARLDPRPQADSRLDPQGLTRPAEQRNSRFVRLTRHALLALRDPTRAVSQDPTIAPRQVDDQVVDLWPQASVRSMPVGAWQDGRYHATVLRVVNDSAEATELDVRRLRGHWLAATVEHSRLDGVGRGEDSGLLVLVSDKPFAEALLEATP